MQIKYIFLKNKKSIDKRNILKKEYKNNILIF